MDKEPQKNFTTCSVNTDCISKVCAAPAGCNLATTDPGVCPKQCSIMPSINTQPSFSNTQEKK